MSMSGVKVDDRGMVLLSVFTGDAEITRIMFVNTIDAMDLAQSLPYSIAIEPVSSDEAKNIFKVRDSDEERRAIDLILTYS